MLNGEIPYRDFWDHKPPMIYLINAAGLAIGRNSRWGVWLLECCAILIAAWIGLSIGKKLFGSSPAILSMFLWLGTLVFVIQGGNFTTEYTLPLQFFALWLVYDIGERDPSPWRWVLLGLTGAVAFFTKQTAAGLWAAIVVYTVYRRLTVSKAGLLIRELLFFSLGVVLVSVAWVAYFAVHGALPQFWSAAFAFNFLYCTDSMDLLSRIKPVLTGMGALTKPGIFQMAITGYFLTLLFILIKQTKDWRPPALLIIGLIDLPLEFVLLSASGRTFEHYYMVMLPVLALFTGFAFQILFTGLSQWGIRPRTEAAVAAGIAAVMLWTSLGGYHYQLTVYQNRLYEPLIAYIDAHSAPDDSVLLWGSEPSLYFYSMRAAPTRFMYFAPIYRSGYTNEEMLNEFPDDILDHPPVLIIDLHNSASPFLELPIMDDAILSKIEFLRSHYEEVQATPDWTIYRHSE
jgi:4-amino-4-deoxy-L-arabinose transferase-like glycosyltransferase